MGGYYKWDTELISALARKIEAEVNDLVRDSSNLQSIKADVDQAWQSVAGMTYSAYLEVNKAEIDAAVAEGQELKGDLDRATQVYSTAESEIAQIVSDMYSKITH